MTNLPTPHMVEVAETFNESLSFCLNNLVDESKIRMKIKISEIILKEKPYMLLTAGGIPHFIDLVFGDSEFRDFVLNLNYVFYTRLGESDEIILGLIGNIARGAGLAVTGTVTNRAMPTELNSRLSTTDSNIAVLTANKWMVVVLLMLVCVSIQDIK